MDATLVFLQAFDLFTIMVIISDYGLGSVLFPTSKLDDNKAQHCQSDITFLGKVRCKDASKIGATICSVPRENYQVMRPSLRVRFDRSLAVRPKFYVDPERCQN